MQNNSRAWSDGYKDWCNQLINLHNVQFVRSVVLPTELPNPCMAQVAFAGRSNVGKSSMINCLLGRKALARVSATPGKTAHINLFEVDGKAYFVDLPGYGFAKVSMEEKKRWSALMEQYFTVCGVQQRQIRLGVAIVDIRHAPTAEDVAMIQYFKHYAIPFVVVANKCDKLTNRQIPDAVQTICQVLQIRQDRLVIFSAVKKIGKEQLWSQILTSLQER